MSNIVISEAASWTKEEYTKNLEVLAAMGMDKEIEEVKRLRKKGLEDTGLEPATLETLQEDTDDKKKGGK